MKIIVLFALILISSSSLFAKDNILGKWICNKILYQNGKELEINHPLFSSFISYEFNTKEVFISNNYKEKGTPSNYSINDSELQIGFRKFYFSFLENDLILKEIGDELEYHFLLKDDFLKENKWDIENYSLIKNDTIYRQSFNLNPEFNNNISFSNYLRRSIPNYSKVSTQRHQFKGSFVIRSDNKITDINVERGINESFDKNFRKAVMSSEKYWSNNTGKSILIEQKFNFFEQGKYFVTDLNWKFYHQVKQGDSYYKSFDFAAAAEEYKKALLLEINENEFTQSMVHEMAIKLGISYLAINEINSACESFAIVGDVDNFSVRNFILNFCK